MWLVAVAEGVACTGPDYEVRVVGWSADGRYVVTRSEQKGGDEPEPGDPFLQLSLVDLAAGRSERSWVVLSTAERSDAALRGKRWKAAEAELVARGVVFDPAQVPLTEPWGLAGVDQPLSIDQGTCEHESRTYAITGPLTHFVLKQVGSCSAEASLFAWTAWRAPEGRGLYLIAQSGCVGNTFEAWVPRAKLANMPP